MTYTREGSKMTEYAGSLPSLTPGMVDQVFQRVQLHLRQTEEESNDLTARIQEGVRIALQELWKDLGAEAAKTEIRLTERQYQVIKLMAEQNLQYKQIAAALQLGVSTIRTHINNVYKKLPPTKRNRGYVAKIFLEGKVAQQKSNSAPSTICPERG